MGHDSTFPSILKSLPPHFLADLVWSSSSPKLHAYTLSLSPQRNKPWLSSPLFHKHLLTARDEEFTRPLSCVAYYCQSAARRGWGRTWPWTWPRGPWIYRTSWEQRFSTWTCFPACPGWCARLSIKGGGQHHWAVLRPLLRCQSDQLHKYSPNHRPQRYVDHLSQPYLFFGNRGETY